MLKGKRASVDDLIYLIMIVVAVGIIILIGFNFMDKFNGAVQGMSSFNANAKAATNAVTQKFPGVVDGTFLFLTIGLCIVALALAFLVRLHPIFFIFYIIFVPIIIYISAAFSNLYQEAAASAALADVASRMVFMSHIIQYLPMIIGIFGFLLAFIMYNTWRTEA